MNEKSIENPLVSVVMTSCNHENYIEKAILSILKQSYDNIELIVIDDGSKDGSIKKIENLQKTYEFTFIKKENEGLVETINKGFKLSRGEYVIFHGSDDISFNNRIKQQISALQNNSDCAYVSSNFLYINEATVLFDIHKKRAFKGRKFDFNDFMNGNAYSIIIATMFRRDALEKVFPLKKEYLSEDFQLFTYITHNGGKCLIWEDDPVVAYRVHNKGLSKTKLPELMLAQQKMLGNYRSHPNYNKAINNCKLQIYKALLDKNSIKAFSYALNNRINIFSFNIIKDNFKLFIPTLFKKYLKKSFYVCKFKALGLPFNFSYIRETGEIVLFSDKHINNV